MIASWCARMTQGWRHRSKRLSCNDQWLIGNGCPSNIHWICEECDQCPVHDNEMLADWFDDVMWGVIRMSNSSIGGTSESACPTESVDEEECCAGALIGCSLDQRILRHSPLDVYLESFLREEGCYEWTSCKPYRLFIGSLPFTNICGDAWWAPGLGVLI